MNNAANYEFNSEAFWKEIESELGCSEFDDEADIKLEKLLKLLELPDVDLDY